MPDKVIVSNGPATQGQNTLLERVVILMTSKKKVRVRLERDNSYAFQSRYTASLWTGHSWSQVATLLPTEVWVKEATLEVLFKHLLEDARRIVRD
jgi:hypothetical protein